MNHSSSFSLKGYNKTFAKWYNELEVTKFNIWEWEDFENCRLLYQVKKKDSLDKEKQ